MSDAPWGTGRCGCGAVRYTLKSAPFWTHCCHCTECQRLTGTAFALNAMIESDRVTLTGATEETPVETPSGAGQVITRCATCKTPLWTVYGRSKGVIFIRGGTLDQQGQIAPDIHIFTQSKQPWVAVPDGARQVPGFYDYDEVWPEDALARRRAALAR